MYDQLFRLVLTEWLKLYSLKPKTTLVITLILFASMIGGISYFSDIRQKKLEVKRLESLDYKKQIQQLNSMESSVRQLLTFVDFQKRKLQETEDSLSILMTERESLKPLVESDRATVEAFFKAQEERAKSNVWGERGIGFGLGILASLIASFIWFIMSMIIKNKRKEPSQLNDAKSAD